MANSRRGYSSPARDTKVVEHDVLKRAPVENGLFFAYRGLCAEGRADCDGRNGDAGVARDDVPRRSAGESQRPGSYFRQDAQAFHPYRAGRQSGSGTVALRPNQGADHFSREMKPHLPSAMKTRVSFQLKKTYH